MAGIRTGVVMIIDDCQADIAFIRYALETEDSSYRCIDFDCAEEALARAQQNRIDLIIVDQEMPGMSGLTFVRTLRERKIAIPCILISGVLDEEVKDKAATFEWCRAMEKPIDPATFPALIESIITMYWLTSQTAAMAVAGPPPSGQLVRARANLERALGSIGAQHLVYSFLRSWWFHVVVWPILLLFAGSLWAHQVSIDGMAGPVKEVETLSSRMTSLENEQRAIRADLLVIKNAVLATPAPTSP